MMPRIITDHPNFLAAITNAQLRAAGVENMRTDMHLLADFRARMDAAATADADAGEPDAPMPTPAPTAGPSAAEAVRARAVGFLRLEAARLRPAAALALALRTDATPEAASRLLAALPAGAVLDLPDRGIEDKDAKSEAARIEAIAADASDAGRVVELIEAGITTEAAKAILAAMPKAAGSAEFMARVNEGEWFGGEPTTMENLSKGGSVAEGWSKAVAKANSRFETAAPTSAIEPQATGGPRFGADQ
jgi:hypothetical protein